LSKRPLFDVIVVGERCKECEMCIKVCPKKMLFRGNEVNSRGYHITYTDRPEECTGCRICEYTCPDFAIFIRPSANPRYIAI
jgi:2-oxoglutarate ferredoxin oxidoreductase subunit delta